MRKFTAKILVSAFILTFLLLEAFAQPAVPTPHVDIAQALNIKFLGGATFVF
jgi:hypothetical protein